MSRADVAHNLGITAHRSEGLYIFLTPPPEQQTTRSDQGLSHHRGYAQNRFNSLPARFFNVRLPPIADIIGLAINSEHGHGESEFMIAALLLQAALPAAPTITLAEANTMSPSALAARLLPERPHRPVVDAIINGRGLTPPSQSVNRVWIVEQMVPYDTKVCRSHVYEIELKPKNPTAKHFVQAVPTQRVKIEEYDRLWVPPTGAATIATCAAAPAKESGFSDGGLGLQQVAALVEQARTAFKAAQHLRISCRGERDICGESPRRTLAALDWSSLGLVEQVTAEGESYYFGDPKPVDAAWGPAHVQFTFPYAANGATWVITVDRRPAIKRVRMEAQSIIYH